MKRLLATTIALACCSAATAEDDAVETVVVTGSYIAGSPEDAPSPVQVIGREDLVASGVSDLSEAVRNLEIASGSDVAPQNETRSNGNAGAGLANVNLRGLGPTATLVLLDGKRLPFAGQKLADGDRFVDINSIPITMIERVEVLKDGGSAIYGSDAIAGVVNFITRKNFEGFEVTAKHTGADGGQEDQTLGAIFGWASDDAATNIVIGGEWFDRSSQRYADNDVVTGVYDKQNPQIVNRFSFGGPDRNCEANGYFTNTAFLSDPQACYRSGNETENIVPAQERKSVMVTAEHSFGDGLTVYGQANWIDTRSGETRNVTVGPIEPKFYFPGFFGLGAALNSGSPFVFSNPSLGVPPFDNGGTIPIGALELSDFDLRSPGLEPRRDYDQHSAQETTRWQVGAKGDFEFADRSWSWDVSWTRGDSEYSTNFLGIDKNRLELAHYGLGGPNCVPNGSVTDPTARFLISGLDGQIDSSATAPGAVGPLEAVMASLIGNVEGFPSINPDMFLIGMTSTNNGDITQGCHFYNAYSSPRAGGANSEELLRWLEVEMDDAQQSDTFLEVADAVLTGELMQLDAGPVGMAIGLQYRKEGRETTVHPQTIGSVNSFGMLAGNESVAGLSENRNYDEDRDINAAFVEFLVPLHEDVDVQLAARYEDYGGSIGSTFDPKLGIRWQASDSFVVRGSASSSFRGPALAQLREGTGFSLEFGVVDRLGEQAVNPAGLNCVRTGRCGLPSDDVAPSIIIVKKGEPSPELEPETAVTWNLGFIWSPADGPLEGLTLGMDYYVINFEDKITDVPTQAFLTEELALFNAALAAGDFVVADPTQPDFGTACDPSQAQFDPGQPRGEACQVNPAAYAITPATSSFAGGTITRRVDTSKDLQIIGSQAINTGKVDVDGLDVNMTYAFDTDAGSFVLDSNIAWIRAYEVKDFPVGQPDFDAAGFTNNDPNRRLSRSMPDLKGNVGLTWLRDRHFARGNLRFVGPYEDNGTAINIIDEDIDAYYAFDLVYSYALPVADGDLTITLGAIDLFDADVPELKNSNGTDVTTFDVRGRRLYAALKYAL